MSYKNIFSLEGKVAVVTGGYGHIGKELTKALYDFGAKVYVAGRSLKKFQNIFRDKNDIHFIKMDINNLESIKQAYQQIYDNEGKINVLVNNAVSSISNHPEKMTDEEFRIGIDGTLNSVFRCIREVIPYMKQTGGNIINISSMYGIVAPHLEIYNDYPQFLNPPNYGSAKAGVIQLTKYYAVALAKYNIKVNCISPGAFPSEIVKKEKGFIEKLEENIPLKRVGNPKELAGVLILLSSEASSYITGQNIIVDGGWTVW